MSAAAGQMNLLQLPVELLYEIQFHAVAPSFPLASKRLYVVFKSAPPSVNAEYLISSFHQHATYYRTSECISVSLRFPICNQQVVEAILHHPRYSSSARPTKIDLPRRLFRTLTPRPTSSKSRRYGRTNTWSEDDAPLPFLRHLCGCPELLRLDIDSDDGYALTKAVFAGFGPLVQFLLAQGASPAKRDGMAVKVAIRRKDLVLVRMLIEPDETAEIHQEGSSGPSGGSKKAQGSAKRRKLEDRLSVSQDMLKAAVQCDAREIVEYFMKEKGCVPNMQTLLRMGK